LQSRRRRQPSAHRRHLQEASPPRQVQPQVGAERRGRRGGLRVRRRVARQQAVALRGGEWGGARVLGAGHRATDPLQPPVQRDEPAEGKTPVDTGCLR